MEVFNLRKVAHIVGLGVIATCLIVGALFLASFISTSEDAQNVIASLGYTGVLLVAIIGGLNSIAPLPPAALVPLFTASGLHLPIIVAMLVIGTTIADYIGYALGKWGKDFVAEHYSKTYKRIKSLKVENSQRLFWFVFIYAFIIPFPNEAFLIPLGVLGVPFRKFVFPLVLGTIIYHTIGAYGMQGLFTTLFH